MIARSGLWLSAAALLTCSPPEVRAQAGDAVRLTIRIVDSRGGQPLRGAVVELSGLPEPFVTDEAGTTSFDAPLGTYVLSVRRTGYEGIEGDFMVKQSGSITLRLNVMEESGEPGRLVGTVVDGETQQPVEGAAVTIRGQGPMISDSRGRFAFDDVEPGDADIQLERLGYRDRTENIAVQAGRTTALLVHIAAEPIELDPITVEVRSRFLEMKGVYRRMERGVAERLVTRDQIEMQDSPRFSDSLDGMAGVNLIRINRRAILLGRSRCQLRIFMDGIQMQPDMEGSVDIDQIPPDWVEMAEVYSGIASVPPEYADVRQDCGVMLIWSRQKAR